MPVATTSSGRALYDHASTAFIRNMPFEALLTTTKAIHTGQANDSQQLAEQFLILQITALCAIYAPNDPEQIKVRWQKWLQANSRPDDQDSLALSLQLQLEPTSFIASVWTQALRFYSNAPTIPSLKAKAPSEGTLSIVPETDTLLSALQLPAPVVEALILGALKIDEDIARSHVKPTKGIANGKSAKNVKGAQPGVQSARAVCEWLLSAHSDLTTKQVELSEADHIHLYDQHNRVLRLYSLDVLGLRQNEWEYAGEMVRCAKLMTEGQAEIEERAALLSEIIQAQASADTRVERLQAAKDRAKRIMSDQLEKKKQDAVKAQNSPSLRPPLKSNTAPIANPKKEEKHQRQQSGHQSKVSPPAEKYDQKPANGGKAVDLPGQHTLPIEQHQKRGSALPVSNRSGNDVRPSDTISSLRNLLNAWLRHFGGATGLAFALIAVLLTIRRGVVLLRSRMAPSASSINRARLSGSTAHATPDPNRGLIGTAWQKIVNTVRM